MSDPRTPADHLALAAAHLVRAASAWISDARKGGHRNGRSGGGLAQWILGRIDAADPEQLAGIRAALAAERARWSNRARQDPTAARVRDIFSALCDVFEARGGSERAADSPEAAEFDRDRDAWDTRR